MNNGESIVRSPTEGPPQFFTGRTVGVRAWDSVAVSDGADLSGVAVVPKVLLALRS